MKKRRVELFQTNDNEAIEKHLDKMAKKGWFLKTIGTYFWTYEKGEPKDLTYEVTYFSEASDFNPYPTDNQEAYYEYCEAAGWTLVAAKDKLQVFSTASENPTPIESDEALKFQSIHKSMKKSMILIYGLLLIVAIFQLICTFIILNINPLLFYTDSIGIYSFAIWITLVLGIIYYFLDYGVWYHGTKKAIASGSKYQRDHYKGRRIVNIVMLFLSIILVIPIIRMILSNDYWWIGLMIITMIIAIVIVSFIIKRFMKKIGSSGKVNIAVTLVAVMITVILSIGFTLLGMDYVATNRVFERKAYGSYSFTDNYGNLRTYDIYKDSLPLTLEDLGLNFDNKDYSYRLQQEDSYAISYIYGSQVAPAYLNDAPQLHYELAHIKIKDLYDTFKDYFVTKYESFEEGNFILVDDIYWGADKAYQLTMNGRFYNVYLICYEDKILAINLGYSPDLVNTEQIEVIREKLIGDELKLKYTIKKGLLEDNINFGGGRT